MFILLVHLLTQQVPDTTVHFRARVYSTYLLRGGSVVHVHVREPVTRERLIYILDVPSLWHRQTISLQTSAAWGDYDAGELCHAGSKLYHSVATQPPGISVLDVVGESLFGHVNVGVSGRSACSRTSSRLYVAGLGVGYVIDCATDSVVKVLNPLDSVAGVSVWDSAGNKVYMGGWGWRTGDRLNVINCATDSVVRSFPTGVLWARYAVYYPQRRRIYLQGEEAIGHSAVIDCAGDSVIRRYRSFYGLEKPVVVPREDKVYWHDIAGMTTDSLQVTDCRAETVLHCIEPPWPPPKEWWLSGMTYAEWSNRLYVIASARVGGVPGHWLVSIDCATDSVLGWAQLPDYGIAVEANPFDRRIYVVSFADSAIYVYRDEVPAVCERGLPTSPQLAVVVDVTPNPFSGNARVQYTVPVAGPARFKVYSSDGRLVQSETRMALRGAWVEFELDGRSLGNGVYLVQVQTPAGTVGAKATVLR